MEMGKIEYISNSVMVMTIVPPHHAYSHHPFGQQCVIDTCKKLIELLIIPGSRITNHWRKLMTDLSLLDDNWTNSSIKYSFIIFNTYNSLIKLKTLLLKQYKALTILRWRQNGRDSVSNHQPHDCLLNLLFRRRSKKTSKLRVTCLCARNSPGTGEFPAQMASNAENDSIWWRHHEGYGFTQHASLPIMLIHAETKNYKNCFKNM